MKINTKSNKKKVITASLVIALVILIGSSSFYVLVLGGNLFGWQIHQNSTENNDKNTPESPTINEGPATNEQIDTGEVIKKDSVNPDKKPAGASSNVGVIITTAEQTDSMLQVRALIQTITNTGTCTLTLSKNSDVITKHADVQAQANATTCKGFDTPLTELSAGEWSIAISFSNTTQTGAASVVKIIE